MTDAPSANESSVLGEIRSVPLPCPFRGISNVCDHDEYIQMLINGRTTAELQKSPANISWRGFSTKISPDFVLTRANLRSKLLEALNKIKLSEVERQVNIQLVVH